MSDAMTDAYRMEKEADERENKHQKLLNVSHDYFDLNNKLDEQHRTLQIVERAINIMTKQKEEMLNNYIDKN
jgi:hypothetical protein